ncbi:MAG: hypothetical protein IKO25_09235 [Clostridia bacterium]|nr:hypothetical protein [Clostridia bacterium]
MNSKQKGTRGEHEIESILLRYGFYAHRNDQIFKGGKNNPDVFASLSGKSFHVEVKRVEKLNISAAMAQASRDAGPNAMPVVAHRKNRESWLITIPLIELLELLKERKLIPDEREASGRETESGQSAG